MRDVQTGDIAIRLHLLDLHLTTLCESYKMLDDVPDVTGVENILGNFAVSLFAYIHNLILCINMSVHESRLWYAYVCK